MKTYLSFSIEGEITEIKIKDKQFNIDKFNNLFKYNENIIYNSYNFIILFNKNKESKKNISCLPFFKEELFGNFLLFSINNNNNTLKSLTENKFLKLINISQKNISDYSSDDFNLSDDNF